MPDVRTSVVESIRVALSRARASARADQDAAKADLAAAQARLDRVRLAAAQRPARAAAERDSRLADLDAAHTATLADLARQASLASTMRAPGAAGEPWESWHPTPAVQGEPPDLLRIGEVRIPRAGTTPALVPLLDHGHVTLVDNVQVGGDAVVAGLLLRALGRTAHGQIEITGYDPERLGGGLAGFAPLAPAGLLRFVGPGGLTPLLNELVDNIRRINETVLAGDYTSLAEMAERTGRRPEPWRVAVLLGGDEPSRHERAQLERILRTGAACGVHLIVRGISVGSHKDVQVIRVDGERATVSGYGALPVYLDEAPPAELVTATCRKIAGQVSIGPAPAVFANLIPGKMWTERSAGGLTAPVGDSPEGRPVDVTLADYPPHALIAGPSGTGKTNLIYAWMGALASRYSPDELAFYLLDFKEGVSFARFAPGRRDPSWLPHVRLVGVNVNTDREFGLALLRFLGDELRRRADAAKEHEVTKLSELRHEDPKGHWPRIVAVIDEFQILLTGRDALAQEAATLLEDLARRGRSQGIHLILASQDVSGIEALWGRPALVAQFTLRIALPKARRILHEANLAAETLPGTTRWSTPTPGRRTRTASCASPRPATVACGASFSTGCGRTGRHGWAPPASSTATRYPGSRRHPTSRSWRRARPTRPRWRCSASRSTCGPTPPACRSPARPAATWPCSVPGWTRRARCSPPPPAPSPGSTPTATPASRSPAWTRTPRPPPRRSAPTCPSTPAGTTWRAWPRSCPRSTRTASGRITSSSSPSTPPPPAWRSRRAASPATTTCAASSTPVRSAAPTYSAGGVASAGSATTWAASARARTRSVPGWRWTCRAPT
ncbi:hypothetical protein Pflav_019060 [Phytohabitans flavus]|uniref:FtsK domain-containing protein n=1 Tax=Phytohabitans flavus TaxID=1076124 RepID=A0A6F8XNV2_9ACTN|nr:hypothetical protein Pflav_019060 [Phytohabitans flavus]